jgi:hypothetical protein
MGYAFITGLRIALLFNAGRRQIRRTSFEMWAGLGPGRLGKAVPALALGRGGGKASGYAPNSSAHKLLRVLSPKSFTLRNVERCRKHNSGLNQSGVLAFLREGNR